MTADVNGWLDLGSGLSFKTHYFSEGVAICDSRLTWGKRRLAKGSDLPGPNSCQKCLLAFAQDFTGEAGE